MRYVCTRAQAARLRVVLQETLLGPSKINLQKEVSSSLDPTMVIYFFIIYVYFT